MVKLPDAIQSPPPSKKKINAAFVGKRLWAYYKNKFIKITNEFGQEKIAKILIRKMGKKIRKEIFFSL